MANANAVTAAQKLTLTVSTVQTVVQFVSNRLIAFIAAMSERYRICPVLITLCDVVVASAKVFLRQCWV